MIQNRSLSTKLYVAFSVLLALMLIITGNGIYRMNQMKAAYDVTSRMTARKLLLSDAINTAESDMYAAQRGMVIAALENQGAAVEQAYREYNEALAVETKSLTEIKPLLTTVKGRQSVATIEQALGRWTPLAERVYQESRAGRGAEAAQLSRQTQEPYAAIGKVASDLAVFYTDMIKGEQKQSDESASQATLVAVLMTVVAFGVSAAVFLLVRRIVRGLAHVSEVMTDSAENVARASEQVASASQELARGSSEQAAALEQTSASTHEIGALTNSHAHSAREAARLMAEVHAEVESGNRSIGHMVASMKAINESSDKISRIIKAIDEIAFQTNILALNAAVEAARAGEAGMGFAVVADEVRNLAQRSAQAARDTAGLIEESITRSREGALKIEDVTQVIGRITTTAESVRKIVDEVNQSSQEQSRGMSQIGTAIGQMEKTTQVNAAAAEESASASEELSTQAETMREMVRDLEMLVHGVAV